MIRIFVEIASMRLERQIRATLCLLPQNIPKGSSCPKHLVPHRNAAKLNCMAKNGLPPCKNYYATCGIQQGMMAVLLSLKAQQQARHL